MSRTPNYDQKIQEILAATKPGERVCALTGEKWNMTDEEIGWYKKFNVPPLPHAPYTRICLVYGWSNGVQWWWNKHAETGKPILSYVHPASGYKVLPDLEWHAQDFSDHTVVYEPGVPVFDHIQKLLLQIPLPAQRNVGKPENSITMVSLGDQDSYFVTGSKSKRTFFATTATEVEDSMLLYHARYVTNSYQVGHSRNIHNCSFVRESSDCSNSAFLFDCRNCEHCFGATNQRNKKYLWMNEQLTKDEWEKRHTAVDFSRRSSFEKYLADFRKLMASDTIWPENFNDKIQGKTSGEYILECIDCEDCYFVEGSENLDCCSFVFTTPSEDCYMSHGLVGAADCIVGLTVKNSQSVKFCYQVVDSRELEYCFNCYNCEHCFGCVGIKNKKFHIFNTPYHEEEYWATVDRIKCQMLEEGSYGSFFPISWTYVCPPESGMGMYLQLSNEEIEKLGAPVFDPHAAGAMGDLGHGEAVPVASIPDSIDEMEIDAWVGKQIYDADLDRRFTFLKPELEYYKEHRLFPPNTHFISRMKKLIHSVAANRFMDATCGKCRKSIRTAVFSEYPDRKIYCRPCYVAYLEKRG